MSKKSERKRLAELAQGAEQMLAPGTEAAQTEGMQAAQAAVEAPKAATALTLVLGPKAPKHRVGHNSAAWAVITPMLPATATSLAEAVGKVPNIGGPKGNGMLYVSYAIRRGWLAKQA